MRIIFVRHGEPNYTLDCLTEEGKAQAQRASERLAGEGISEIYSSPCGRARETAEYTARMLNLPVTVLEYMHEISWGGEDTPYDGHPWTLGDLMLQQGFDFYREDWRTHPYFAHNMALDYQKIISGEIDGFLREQGYIHEERRYLCQTGEEKTIALFSHGGSGACALAHLLQLPFPYVCSAMPYDYTSLIILNFPVRNGKWVFPRIELYNDTAHIRQTNRNPAIQQVSQNTLDENA